MVVPANEPKTPNDYFLGHRYHEEKGGGWGWIKKANEPWSAAKWSAIKERPSAGALAPWRKMGKRDADHNHEYKLFGYFEKYEAYDPHKDEVMPVFVINGYEDLGEAKPLERKPGPPSRLSRHKKTRAYSRDPFPMAGSGDEDYY